MSWGLRVAGLSRWIKIPFQQIQILRLDGFTVPLCRPHLQSVCPEFAAPVIPRMCCRPSSVSTCRCGNRGCGGRGDLCREDVLTAFQGGCGPTPRAPPELGGSGSRPAPEGHAASGRVVLLVGKGGWPLSLVVTPELSGTGVSFCSGELGRVFNPLGLSFLPDPQTRIPGASPRRAVGLTKTV